jgi:hypothetical protein
MEDKDRIGPLERIRRVDPPPFLFTRIEARIAYRQGSLPARSWVLVSTSVLVLLLAVNTFVMVGHPTDGRSFHSDIGQFAEGMGLQATNQLYHE